MKWSPLQLHHKQTRKKKKTQNSGARLIEEKKMELWEFSKFEL
jgi:hypothetical protein